MTEQNLKQLADLHDENIELKKEIERMKAEREYWRKRCILTERCLHESPCDEDITESQIIAHSNLRVFLNSSEPPKQ